MDNSSHSGAKTDVKPEQDTKSGSANPAQNMPTTPVTTKQESVQHGHYGRHPNQQNNYNNNQNNNNSGGGWSRKPFPNRNNYSKRNEVKFNSNVKNLHKNENIFPKNNNGSSANTNTNSTQTPGTTQPAAVLPTSPVSTAIPQIEYPAEVRIFLRILLEL